MYVPSAVYQHGTYMSLAQSKGSFNVEICGIYRLMHAFFHIRTVIIPRTKALWPISVSQDDNSPDMEKGMH